MRPLLHSKPQSCGDLGGEVSATSAIGPTLHPWPLLFSLHMGCKHLVIPLCHGEEVRDHRWKQRPGTAQWLQQNAGWGWWPLFSGERWPGLSWSPSALRSLCEWKGFGPATQRGHSSCHPLWPQTRLMEEPPGRAGASTSCSEVWHLSPQESVPFS